MSSFLVNPQNGKVFQEQVRTTGQTIGAGLLALVDASAAVTVDAPASPADGTVFAVRRSSGSDDITVDGNGLTIDGAASVVLDSAIYEAVFVCDAGAWYRIEPVRSFGASSVFTLPVQRTEDSGGGGGGAPGASGEVIWNDGGVLAGAPEVTTDGSYVGIGVPADLATLAGLRFTNDVNAIAFRNAAGTDDIVAMSLNASNGLYIGSGLGVTKTAPDTYLFAVNGVYTYVNGAPILNVNGSFIGATVPAQFGAVPASAGWVRFPYWTAPTTYLAVRNPTNTGDLSVISGGVSGLDLGDVGVAVNVRGYSLELAATAIVSFYDGTGYTLQLNGGNLCCAGVLTGGLSGTPMRRSAQAIDLASVANYALSSGESTNACLEFTNAAGGAGTTVTSVAGNIPLAEYVVTVFGSSKLVTFLGVPIATGPTDAYKTVTVRRSLTTGAFIGTSTFTA